eukprot:4346195-Prymnesium_polylepis.1
MRPTRPELPGGAPKEPGGHCEGPGGAPLSGSAVAHARAEARDGMGMGPRWMATDHGPGAAMRFVPSRRTL